MPVKTSVLTERGEFMIKRTIKEITEKYDKDGKLIEKITREETETDDETSYPLQSPTYPSYPWGTNGTPNITYCNETKVE